MDHAKIKNDLMNLYSLYYISLNFSTTDYTDFHRFNSIIRVYLWLLKKYHQIFEQTLFYYKKSPSEIDGLLNILRQN
jgi:hypothetical protein